MGIIPSFRVTGPPSDTERRVGAGGGWYVGISQRRWLVFHLKRSGGGLRTSRPEGQRVHTVHCDTTL